MTEQPPQPDQPQPDQPQPDPQQPPYGQVPPPPPPYQQPGYSQPGYQQSGYQAGYPQPGYPQPGYPQPVYYEPPAHGSATTALVLGILGLVFCPLVLSIPAWVIGRKAMREIDASGGQLGGRGNAKAGFILGIVGTAWGAITALFVIAVFAIGGIVSSTVDDTCTNVNDGTFSSC